MKNYKDMTFNEIREVANNRDAVELENGYSIEHVPDWVFDLATIEDETFDELKQAFLTATFDAKHAKEFKGTYFTKQDLLDDSEYFYKLFKTDNQGKKHLIKTWY